MSDNERDIRELLRAEAGRAPQPTRITSGTVRRAQLKRAVFLTSTILGLAIITGGIAVGVANIGSDGPPVPPAGNEDTTPPDLNPRVSATIAVGQFPLSVEVGYGYVWVTVDNPDESSGFALTRIDPATNEIVDSLPLEHASDMAIGAAAVWVVGYENTTGARLLRIDPETNSVVEAVSLDCVSDLDPPDCFPVGVAGDDTAIWVSLSSDPGLSGEVVRIDPVNNQLVDRIPIDEGGPRDIVDGGDSIWVNVLSDVNDDVVQGGSLVRIDPQANAVVKTLLRDQLVLGGDEFPPVMAGDDDSVWVVKEESHGATESVDTLAVRIDAQTGEITAESGNLVPDFVGPAVFPFAADSDSMWFYGGGQVAVHRLNAETMKVDESVDISDDAINVIDAALDPVTGTIWVASYEGPVIRIDLK